ncbi:hypothetical protein ACWCQS_28475 [Streptomyces sp. NPDC002076]
MAVRAVRGAVPVGRNAAGHRDEQVAAGISRVRLGVAAAPRGDIAP